MKTIEVIISTAGNISINAINFKGADCSKATEYLEAALGVVGKKTKKPEFYQSNKRQQTQHT